MKQILLTFILFLSSITIYGDNFNSIKDILLKKIDIEKAEINLYKLKSKAYKTDGTYLAELQAHQKALKEVKTDLKNVKKAIKAKKKFENAEKKYEKRKETYEKQQNIINDILVKYTK